VSLFLNQPTTSKVKILICIPCHREDVQRAELLLDLIYQLDRRETKGSCLLIFAPEVHEESKTKLKVAAELAFESVDVHEVKQLITVGKEKGAAVHAMFMQAANFIAPTYRFPWLWLEPDCMPLVPNWREKLADTYDRQPKRYLGRRLQADGNIFMSRIGIYPVNVLNDVELANLSQVAYHASIVSKATNSPLFQEAQIQAAAEVNKIRPDAVLLHSDKSGVLADWVRGKAAPQPDVNIPFHPNGYDQLAATEVINSESTIVNPPKRRGRPPKKLEAATV
jgi:hypothetical protein